MLSVAILGIGVAQGQTIPLDPSVKTGKLPNGFTYYIRHNGEPQKRVEMYLVNKVGSILEDDDQLGLAHFMEHMNFNGTKNFPKNNLVDFLQKAGVRFGADLNAYTTFDETVYQLPIPTDNPAMLENGLKIMRDWAQEATLDPTEIEKERGVILEEERLGKGAKDRVNRQSLPVLLNNSRYATRLPIGKDEVLTKFKPDVIRRFYSDWYRPDLQALIIVGDVNVDEAEKLVKEKFAGLKNPTNERERMKYTIPLVGQSHFKVITDKEETSTNLEIVMKHIASPLKTEQDYIISLKQNLFNSLINERRYAELSKEKDPAYQGMSFGISGLLNNVEMLAFNVTTKNGRLQESFAQTWRIVERIKRYGFTPNEFDRVKKNYLRNLQSSVNEQDKTSSVSYVKEYQRLFLDGEASPGINWEYQFTKNHLNDITLSDISNLMGQYLASKDVDIIISAPEKEKDALPDSAAMQVWIKDVQKEEIKPFQEQDAAAVLTVNVPHSGKVVATKDIPQINATELTLSNGIRVILKPTPFKNDQVLYGGFSPGGLSLYDQQDYDVAANASGLIGSFGLGNLNPVQLSKALTGKIANSAANVALRSQTVRGGGSPEDLETALQLTYLQFTSPRKDSLLFKNTIANAVASLNNRNADPNQVFADTINYVMGNYNYRTAPPTAQRIESITLQRAFDIYKERFADASGFTFVFVGNFENQKVIPLIEKYLGSLPALQAKTKARDLGIHIPSGQLVKKVFKGRENKATVRIVLSGDFKYGPLENLQLKALSDILQIKVLQQLRETESEVYSPQVQSSYNKYPQNRFAVTISFGCAPQNVDHLIDLVRQEIKSLREVGPQNDDIEKFKAQYQKNIELALNDNGFWLNYLLSQTENNDDLLYVTDINRYIGKINGSSLKQAARVFLSGKNEISFELLPESLK